MQNTPHFQLRRGRNSAWRFVLVAGNNEIIATSENYTTKAKAVKGIAAVMAATHAIDAWGTKTVEATKPRRKR